MKNNLPKICYWCGIELTSETQKKEATKLFKQEAGAEFACHGWLGF